MEFAIVVLILLFILSYSGTINTKRLYSDNTKFFEIIKEKDYDFLVDVKYKGQMDPNYLFEKRIHKLFIGIAIVAAILLFNFTWINLIIGVIILIVVYRNQYSTLKSFYKKNTCSTLYYTSCYIKIN